jgi:hypothetical protein
MIEIIERHFWLVVGLGISLIFASNYILDVAT